MAKIRYPFLFQHASLKYRPYLQIRITNPSTGECVETLGLIDTGADFFAVPGWLATAIGHKVGSGTPAQKIGTGAGTCSSEMHTCSVDLMDFRNRPFLTLPAAPVVVLPKLAHTLIGVAGCLDRYRLTIDYPGKWLELKG